MIKLTRLASSIAKPFLDLTIVITGVTVAFLLNSWNMKKSERAEKEKVLSSLQIELKDINQYFPSMAEYQKVKSKEWDSLLKENQVADFHQYYYLQPQYNYAIIEYAMATRNSEIVSFDLHAKLLMLYKQIKMLEQAEIYMTEIALAYNSKANINNVDAQNLFLFKRFIGFSKNRANSLGTVNQIAIEILKVIEDESKR